MAGAERDVLGAIRAHAAAGTFADFRDGGSGELPPYDDSWWDDRTIAADDLAELLTSPAVERHRRGVRIAGLRIVGDLDLDEAQIDRFVLLSQCTFGDHRIVLTDARSRGIRMAACQCGPIDATGLHVAGTLALDEGFRASGTVDLTGARIDGDLVLRNAELAAAGVALAADHCRVGRDLELGGASSIGEVRLLGARISGSLACIGARLTNPRGKALSADRVTVDGPVILAGLRARGEVRFFAARVAGQFNASGTRLSNAAGPALALDGATLLDSAFFTDGFNAHGQLRLREAKVTGSVTFSNARVRVREGPAIVAEGATVTGDVYFDEGVQASGTILLAGARIDGQLSIQHARFRGQTVAALEAEGATIAGGVFLGDGLDCEGTMAFVAARLGTVQCHAAQLRSNGDVAFSLDSAIVDGHVRFARGFTVTGRTSVAAADIHGQLALADARMDDTEAGVALDAVACAVRRSIYIAAEYEAIGIVDLSYASAATIDDLVAGWPGQIRTTGLRYETLQSDGRGWADRAELLRREVVPSPASYHQLAAVYRSSGDDVDARKILMERHWALVRRNRPEHWRYHFPPRLRRAWRYFLGITIGHGYEPWRVLWFLVPVLVAMSAWNARADHQDLFTPTSPSAGVTSSACTGDYPCLQPLVYALDTLIPVVDFGQRSRWTPDASTSASGSFYDNGRWLAAATWFTAGLGWVFATLIIAGFTGVIRRE